MTTMSDLGEALMTQGLEVRHMSLKIQVVLMIFSTMLEVMGIVMGMLVPSMRYGIPKILR